jgi:hypothetical protein
VKTVGRTTTRCAARAAFGMVITTLGAATVHAQYGLPDGRARIIGSVLDSATARPIIRTNICRSSPTYTAGPMIWACAQPDTSGRFKLDTVPAGVYKLSFVCEGAPKWIVVRDTIELKNGAVRRVDIRASTDACDMRPFHQGRGVFSGHWRGEFESSVFRPCGDTISGWLNVAPESNWDTLDWPEPKERQAGPRTYFLRFEGDFRGPWRFGHLGMSNYEFVVDRLLEVRVATREDCK